MNHLLRDLAPVPARRGRDRDRGQAHARALPDRPPARRLRRAPRPDVSGRRSAASPRARRAGRRLQGRSARCNPSSSCAPQFTLARPSSTPSTAGASRPTSAPCVERRLARGGRRPRRVPRHPRGQINGIAESSPHEEVALGEGFREYPTWVAMAVARLPRPASKARTASRSARAATPASSRPPRTAAIRSSSGSGSSSTGPWSSAGGRRRGRALDAG